MRIGLVDLDTSHPAAWMPIIREMGHEVAGVLDHGDVHPAAYANRFACEHGIDRVFESPSQMVEAVDAVILHGCDWDRHVERARPFVDAGKGVLIDKPLAGRLADLRQLSRWAAQGARITGGSSLRFCHDVRQWLLVPEEKRGRPHTVFCGCAVDLFNYGIHAYSLLHAIMGPGAVSVRHLGEGPQRRVQVNWRDGRIGLLCIGALAQWMPYYATIVTETGFQYVNVDTDRLYRTALHELLPYVSGQTDRPPLPFDELVEPELCALAAKQSWLQEDRLVALDELADATDYDGAAFAASYRRAKYPV